MSVISLVLLALLPDINPYTSSTAVHLGVVRVTTYTVA